MIMDNFQRTGSSSNAAVGKNFEDASKSYFKEKLHLDLSPDYPVDVGISREKKPHKFDLGDAKTLVECKSHRWTSGDNIPSAKLTVWNEAMYYFSLTPNHFRKIFFVEHHFSDKRQKSLAKYYVERYGHLIPSDVAIWEFDSVLQEHEVIKADFKNINC